MEDSEEPFLHESKYFKNYKNDNDNENVNDK